jgi:hypothetical protein
MRIIEELLERKVAALVYKTEINGRGNSLHWPRDTLRPLKLALTSPTSGGRSVGIVRWRTKVPEFFSSVSSGKCRVSTSIRSLPSKSFLIHHSSVILLSEAA